MNSDPSFIAQRIDDLLWLRLLNRGSFMNSPSVKAAADEFLAQGGVLIVIDMEICQGVDSTFMGTLIGISNSCEAAGGALQIASPTERTRSAMESLGLDMILEIDPPEAPWRSQMAQIRAYVQEQSENEETSEDVASPTLSELDRTKLVLKAHQALSELNEQNKESFGYVCESLEEELRQHEQQAQP